MKNNSALTVVLHELLERRFNSIVNATNGLYSNVDDDSLKNAISAVIKTLTVSNFQDSKLNPKDFSDKMIFNVKYIDNLFELALHYENSKKE